MSVNRTVNAALPGLRQIYALRQELLFTSDTQNSNDIASPFVHNTLQKWGKPVVTRYMSLYMIRFFT